MPVRNLLVIIFAAIVSMACYEKAHRNRYASMVSEAMAIIDEHYVEPVETRNLFESAMDGMIGSLDPYSSFISSQDFQQFQESLDQEFGGIGIVVELSRETERLTVMSPVVGTPAYKAGMQAGDVILEIAGQSTENMSLKDAVTLMRGKPGTPIRLLVQHAGDESPVRLTIKRAIIPVKSVLGDTRRDDGSWKFYLEENPRIGYVRINSFGERTTEELSDAIRSFQDHQIDALIMDLRNNAGGLLTAAVDSCDLFLDGGRVVSTRGRNGQIRRQFDANPSVLLDKDIPLVVLANQFSASASEIVAGCLQDHNRALIVGQRTWGKGTVQNIIEMEGGRSALKLTTASYWRPSGKNIHRRRDADEDDDWGIRPNEGFDVALTDEEFQRVLEVRRQRDIVRTRVDGGEAPEDQVGTESFDDPQLRKAIDYLEGELQRLDARSQRA